MTSINPNFNNNYDLKQSQIRFKAEPQMETAPEVQLPDIYYSPLNNKPMSFKETVKKYDVMGLIYNWLEHPFMMLGTCMGISYGIDLFDKSCNKPINESIIGKAANFGDRIEQSDFIQNKGTQKVLKTVGSGWEKTKNFFKKSSVIRSMFETPSLPEYDLPKGEIKDMNYRLVEKFRSLANKFNLFYTEEKAKINKLSLKELTLDEGEIQYLKDTYKVDKISAIKDSSAAHRINLRRLGKTEAEITNLLNSGQTAVFDEIRRLSGLTNEELKLLMEDTEGKYVALAEKASKNLENLRVLDGKITLPGKHQPFANTTGFREITNRIRSITPGAKNGAKTKTGAAMSKFLQMLHRGFTFGGTKLGVLFFVAPALVDMFLNTKKADPDRKVGTVADGLIRSVSWVFIFPLALKTMHAFGGIQYAGMGKEKVAEYRKRINDFNKLVDEKKFATKGDYNRAKDELKGKLKELKEVKDQSLFTRMLRKISAFTKADLEKIKSYKNDSFIGNLWRKMPNFLKDASYSPARFLVFMMALVPFYDKIIEKCSSKIFGKPYDAMKEEEHLEEKKKQEEFTMKDLQERMLDLQKAKMSQSGTEQINQVNTNNLAEVKARAAAEAIPQDNIQQAQPEVQQNIQTENKQANQELVLRQPEKQFGKIDNYTYVPSSDNILKDAVYNLPQTNKYIPSQLAGNFAKTFDNSGLDAALKRANRAEKRALDVLAGNFNH